MPGDSKGSSALQCLTSSSHWNGIRVPLTLIVPTSYSLSSFGQMVIHASILSTEVQIHTCIRTYSRRQTSDSWLKRSFMVSIGMMVSKVGEYAQERSSIRGSVLIKLIYLVTLKYHWNDIIRLPYLLAGCIKILKKMDLRVLLASSWPCANWSYWESNFFLWRI